MATPIQSAPRRLIRNSELPLMLTGYRTYTYVLIHSEPNLVPAKPTQAKTAVNLPELYMLSILL